MSNLDEKTKSLNQSGAFLQIYALNELRKKHWSVTSEYPITISQFANNPKKLLHPRQVALAKHELDSIHYSNTIIDSRSNTDAKETSIDIVASKIIHGSCYNLCIESKKLDPRFSDWVFFRQESHKNTMRIFCRTVDTIGIVDLFDTLPTKQFQFETHLKIGEYGDLEFTKHIVTDFALALKNRKVETDFYKSEKTKIDESSRQIIEGIFGFMIESVIADIREGEPTLKQPLDDVFIPIVVTNANLFLCDYDENAINPDTGRIEKDPKYQTVDSVVYECPVPKSIRFPEIASSHLSYKQRNAYSKWHVLILSPKGFIEFLDKIEQAPIFQR